MKENAAPFTVQTIDCGEVPARDSRVHAFFRRSQQWCDTSRRESP